MTVSATEARDWALYADWCDSWGRAPEDADADVVQAFLSEFPATDGTQQNRTRAIRKELERRGYSVTLPVRAPKAPLPTLVRVGEAYASTEEALTQLPRARRVTGLRGRRDAFLLILVGVLQFSRRQIQTIRADNIDLSAGIRIHGRFVPTGNSPHTCPACAVTRWLRVIGVYGVGFRTYAFQLLDPQVALRDIHDCEMPLDDDWTEAPQLLPAIDQHGWIRDGAPLSLRSISEVSGRVQRFSGLRELGFTPHEPTGRFKDATTSELVEAQDDVDAAAAELLERSKRLLDSMDDLLAGL